MCFFKTEILRFEILREDYSLSISIQLVHGAIAVDADNDEA